MTITKGDIEMNEKATVDAVVVKDLGNGEDQKTFASSGCASGSCSIRVAATVGPSVYQSANVAEILDPDKREANLCCGSCCDLLRACIIVNIVQIILSGLAALFVIWGIALFDTIDLSDDDQVAQETEAMLEQTGKILLIAQIKNVLGILFGIVGIVGAVKYNGVLVLIAGIYNIISVIACGVLLDPLGAIVSGVYAYVHIALFLALKKGQIKRETYHDRERYCCCDNNAERR
jgi:hypothetical protein